MRLLGFCPNCGAEDTIRELWRETSSWDDHNKVKCDACGKIWADWLFGLVLPEKKRGNKLIPVEVERNRYNSKEYGVQLTWPAIREIQAAGTIISVLNTALITRFNLRVCFASEGGVEGVYRGCYIELRNSSDPSGCFGHNFGLYVEDPDYHQSRGLIEVLDFYEKMLKLLFEEEFILYGKKYRRGEILKLPRENKDIDVNEIWKILMAMLIKASSKRFAQKVIKTLVEVAGNPFGAPYLRGLGPEEILKFFVPPPFMRNKENTP